MSRIVCNSGPLIALGILGKLELLQSIFDEVVIPDAVQKEIAQGGVKLAGLENFQQAQWIRIVSPRQNDVLLSALLDAGEAAVIALAREQRISMVLIDERKARKVARDICGLQPNRHSAHFGGSQKEKFIARDRFSISKAPAGRVLDSRFDCRNGLA